MNTAPRTCSSRTSRVVSALSLLLLLAACNAQYGLPVPGYGYPGGLSQFAPRMGKSGNYVYYTQFEAYYHPATQQFYYPNGKTWEVKPTVLNTTAREVRATPGVPFQFPDHPSKYHEQVKQAFPTTWTPGKGRFDEPYEFGRSGWDIDRR
ncbi:hypothetical protein [Prosthecobacter sp.]|uniref:hypothetical protein n=1 Tax=Prosthecobacter sp. TaxID=1965333 RepID=UPI0037851832